MTIPEEKKKNSNIVQSNFIYAYKAKGEGRKEKGFFKTKIHFNYLLYCVSKRKYSKVYDLNKKKNFEGRAQRNRKKHLSL